MFALCLVRHFLDCPRSSSKASASQDIAKYFSFCTFSLTTARAFVPSRLSPIRESFFVRRIPEAVQQDPKYFLHLIREPAEAAKRIWAKRSIGIGGSADQAGCSFSSVPFIDAVRYWAAALV